MKLDILAFGAHPDDVELAASGTLVKHVLKGYQVGIIDLTKGELGSRGDAESRAKEAKVSSQILGIHVRENLEMPDGFFEVSQENLLKVIQVLRKYQPTLILANAKNDRHPDHAKGAELVARAAYLSGLVKIKTTLDGKDQKPFRPKQVFHYIQDHYIAPDFVVGIDETMEIKMKSIAAYSTQFFNPQTQIEAPETPISSKEFYEFLIARAREFGRVAACEFGEGFTNSQAIKVNNLFDIS